MNTILDFSEYLERKARPLIATMHDEPSPDDEENARADKWNRDNYDAPRGICPFCHIQSPVVHQSGRFATHTTVWQCEACGWWEHETEYRDGAAIGHPAYTGITHQAFLRAFRPSSPEVPLQTLISAIHKDGSLVHDVDPRKFEQLVQHVFGAYYSCEVVHCGRSHDGGVDLVMVDGESPTLIQVKRRCRKDAVETISAVRELLGVLLVERSRKGIFVSTADHFSPDAQKTVSRILSEATVTRLELINKAGLLERLNAVGRKNRPAWEHLIRT